MAMVAGVIARWWARRPALLQVGGWLLAGALVWTTAVLVHPSPQTRLAGGEDRAPSRPVHTQEGEVVGVHHDDRPDEILDRKCVVSGKGLSVRLDHRVAQ